MTSRTPPTSLSRGASWRCRFKGVPTAPIYEYHATGDEFAPLGPALTLLHRFCAQGAVVDHVEVPVGEHLSEVPVGAPGALQFLEQRFAGKPPTNSCAKLANG